MSLSLAATSLLMRLAPLSPPQPPQPTTAQPTAPAGGVANPFETILPSFSFGAAFDNLWKVVFAAFWGLLIILGGASILYHAAKVAFGGDSANPHEVEQSKRRMKYSLAGFGVLIAFVPIISVFFFLL